MYVSIYISIYLYIYIYTYNIHTGYWFGTVFNFPYWLN